VKKFSIWLWKYVKFYGYWVSIFLIFLVIYGFCNNLTMSTLFAYNTFCFLYLCALINGKIK